MLQQVSKRFRDLSYDIGLWKSLYANARVPRPPGPFSWQTYDMLQDILLRSEHLDRTWTSQPCKAIRMSDPFYLDWNQDCICCTTFQIDRLWFVRAEDELDCQLVCYDFKTGSYSVIWKWDRLFLVKVCLDMSVEGRTVFILAMDQVSKFHAKLLRCKVDNDQNILPVSASWDVPSLEGGRSEPIMFFSRASTVYLDGEIPLVFDAISCKFYQVPSGPRVSYDLAPCFLRRIQLLWIDLDVGSLDLRFRVFTLLESGTGSFLSDPEDIRALQLTHEMVVPQVSLYSVSPLVHPPLGPTTQSAQFKLLMRSLSSGLVEVDSNDSNYECLTVTLPGLSPSSNDVLPLSTETQALFTVDTPGAVLYVSEDGYARGLWEGPRHRYRKFSIDASGDVCHAVVGEWSTVSQFQCEEYEEDLMVEEVDCLQGKAYCKRSGAGMSQDMIAVDIE